jgi:hypothetical protein
MTMRCGRCSQLIPAHDETEPSGPIWAGKTIEQMNQAELKAALIHFRNAHIEQFERGVHAFRRMTKMEEALSPNEIKRLERWLEHHAHDAKKGDGTDLWINWRFYK